MPSFCNTTGLSFAVHVTVNPSFSAISRRGTTFTSVTGAIGVVTVVSGSTTAGSVTCSICCSPNNFSASSTTTNSYSISSTSSLGNIITNTGFVCAGILLVEFV